MKGILRIVLMVAVAALLWIGVVAPGEASSTPDTLPDTNFVTADNSKIDLNNANVNAFRRLPGMYPTLARLIVQNAPYADVNDVLSIQGLTDRQRERIQENMAEFTLKRPDNSMQRDRINNANYRL